MNRLAASLAFVICAVQANAQQVKEGVFLLNPNTNKIIVDIGVTKRSIASATGPRPTRPSTKPRS